MVLAKEQAEDHAKDQDSVFKALRKILIKHKTGLVLKDEVEGSKAKVAKEQFHLYGPRLVSINDRKPQPIFVVGIIKQKGYIGFYSMPLYSHKIPISADLKKCLKGMSCLHIKKLTPAIEKELDNLIRRSIDAYAKEGWL